MNFLDYKQINKYNNNNKNIYKYIFKKKNYSFKSLENLNFPFIDIYKKKFHSLI